MSEQGGDNAAAMTDKVPKESIFKGVELHVETNNTKHHTSEISVTELIVRRGQSFTVTLRLTKPFDPARHPLSVVAITGSAPEENLGTMSYFGIPHYAKSSSGAKASWKIKLDQSSAPKKGVLCLLITPPADAPIGDYVITANHRDEDILLVMPVVLFNSWCPEDSVFLHVEKERQEYVMNEQGIIYVGSGNYISSVPWDFAQFEDDMARICMTILDVSNEHLKDPSQDVSSRGDPCYVGRLVSAMINSDDDNGVLLGNWGSSFAGGRAPTHWSGSHAILKQWASLNCSPVKYGQCWVFAAVMCSVMRLLGIPCRVVTNFESAHDTNCNLTIDLYHADYGVRERESPDSIWNFHVWVEAWMKRPDLADNGTFDGWQVLDPTPQEMSDGIYCCGPASVKAIQEGHVDLRYDVPFVFAEVNADCIDWLVKADGTKLKLFSDPGRVGQNISTKSVGSRKRRNITNNYKHREGSEKERKVFKYALTRDFTRDEEEEEEEEATGTSDEAVAATGTSDEAVAAAGTSAGAGAATGTSAGAGAGAATGTSAGAGAATGTSAGAGAGAATGTSAGAGAGAATGTSAGAGAATGRSAGAGAATGTSAGAGAATGRSAGAGAGAATGTSAGAGAATGTSAGAGAATGRSAGAGAGAATGTSAGAGAATSAGVTTDSFSSLPVRMRFKEVTMPLNGEDVKLNLVLKSKSFLPRPLSVNISVQAMNYNGSPGGHIQTVVKEEILLPVKGLSIPILVPYLSYHKHMVECNSMKISAVVTDKENPGNVYLAESDVVLRDPLVSLTVSSPVRLNQQMNCELIFKNPVNETLTDCELTMSGSGLLKDESSHKLPNLPPNKQFRIKMYFMPYKKGERTLMADLDCNTFRDIKASCTFIVAP